MNTKQTSRLSEVESLLIPLMEEDKKRDEIVHFFYPKQQALYEGKCENCREYNRISPNRHRSITYQIHEKNSKCAYGHELKNVKLIRSIQSGANVNWFKRGRQLTILVKHNLIKNQGRRRPLKLIFDHVIDFAICDVENLKVTLWKCQLCGRKYAPSAPLKCECKHDVFTKLREVAPQYLWCFPLIRAFAYKFRSKLFSIKNLAPLIYMDPNKPLAFSFRGFVNLCLAFFYLAKLNANRQNQPIVTADLHYRLDSKILSSLIKRAVWRLSKQPNAEWKNFIYKYEKLEEKVIQKYIDWIKEVSEDQMDNVVSTLSSYYGALSPSIRSTYRAETGSVSSLYNLFSSGVKISVNVKETKEVLARYDARADAQRNFNLEHFSADKSIEIQGKTLKIIDINKMPKRGSWVPNERYDFVRVATDTETLVDLLPAVDILAETFM